MSDDKLTDFDDELMYAAGNLPRDVEPPKDLWPDIEAAIEAPPVISPWTKYLAQAAAVVLLVGGSSGLTYLAVSGDRTNVSPVVQGSVMPLNAATASFGERYTLGPDFRDARSDLESRLEVELDRLSPEARAEVEENMQAIHTAIEEINLALANEPDNVLLQELLLSSYQEELALMRKVNGITSTVMLREDM